MKPAAALALGAVAYMSIAIALLVLASGLGVFAFAVWFRNRDNLRALDQLLKDKARKGMAVLDQHGPSGA